MDPVGLMVKIYLIMLLLLVATVEKVTVFNGLYPSGITPVSHKVKLPLGRPINVVKENKHTFPVLKNINLPLL